MSEGFGACRPHKGLLLVGGLSCSGKTTLINALRQEALPPEIRAALPDDASAWPVIGDSREPSATPPHRKGAPVRQGQILHCDLTSTYFPEMRARRPGGDWISFRADDSGFQRSLADADDIFVLIVRPQRHQLLQQVLVRRSLIHVPPFARRLASRYVRHLNKLERAIPNWMSGLAPKLGPRWKSRALARDQHALLLELYRRPIELDAMLQDWANGLIKVAGRRVRAILHVEPMLGAGREKSFRLVNEMHSPGATARQMARG